MEENIVSLSRSQIVIKSDDKKETYTIGPMEPGTLDTAKFSIEFGAMRDRRMLVREEDLGDRMFVSGMSDAVGGTT